MQDKFDTSEFYLESSSLIGEIPVFPTKTGAKIRSKVIKQKVGTQQNRCKKGHDTGRPGPPKRASILVEQRTDSFDDRM